MRLKINGDQVVLYVGCMNTWIHVGRIPSKLAVSALKLNQGELIRWPMDDQVINQDTQTVMLILLLSISFAIVEKLKCRFSCEVNQYFVVIVQLNLTLTYW